MLAPAYGATQPGPEVSVDYRGTGTVLALMPPPSSLHATRPVIVIRHDPIPGLMDDAMSMPFLAAAVELFRELRAGDRIAFGLRVVPGALLVVHIKRLGPQP
jgi:hypothetical protein